MSYVLVAAGTLAAVSAATSYINARNTANRQDSALAASLRQQGQLQQQANAKTNDLIQQTKDSSAHPAQDSMLKQYTQALSDKQGLAQGGLNQVGKVSDAYTQSANDAAAGINDYANTRAGLISAIDAPTMQRQQEAENLQSFGTQMNNLQQQSSAQQFLANMKLRGIQPNPLLTAVSGIAGGASQGLAAYGGGGMGGAGTGTGAGYQDGGGVVFGGTNLPFK